MAKIFIGIPTYDKKVDVEHVVTAMQLPPLMPEHSFNIDFIASSIITGSRNYLVKRFLESDADWLFFWDADVVIRDTTFLNKLLETAGRLDADIVGGAYRIKHDRELYAFGNYVDGKLVNFKKGELTEPALVDTVATGATLFSRKAFETVPEPWFEFVETKGGQTIPEDHNFCDKARALGLKVAVDPRFPTFHYGIAYWEHSITQ